MITTTMKEKILTWIQKYTMTIILVLVVAFFAVRTNGMLLTPRNINNLIAQNAYVFVLATGMLLCILTGGNIDLSVGSVVCFVGAVGAVYLDKSMPIWQVILIMLGIGLAIGAWQAFWIAYVRVPPFIVTLAGMLIFRGLSNVVLNGQTLKVTNETFVRVFGGGANCYVPSLFSIVKVDGQICVMGDKALASLNEAVKNGTSSVQSLTVMFNGLCLIVGILACAAFLFFVFKNRISRARKGYEVEPIYKTIIRSGLIVAALLFFTYKLSQYKGIPTALIWVALVILLYAYITSKTTIGRHFYAVGGNEKATKLSGINTNRVYFIAYTNMGLLAALAGMLTIARLSSAQPTYGQNYEMDAIGSCFIGGASAYGGVGTVPGVIIGAVLMGVINIGMSIMGVDQNYQKVVKGGVLLAAVIFDVVSKRQKN